MANTSYTAHSGEAIGSGTVGISTVGINNAIGSDAVGISTDGTTLAIGISTDGSITLLSVKHTVAKSPKYTAHIAVITYSYMQQSIGIKLLSRSPATVSQLLSVPLHRSRSQVSLSVAIGTVANSRSLPAIGTTAK